MSGHILVIDQGTTSTRAIVFDVNARPIAIGQEEFRQIFPQPGFVEHDPEDIWRSTLSTIRAALVKADIAPGGIVGIGIANQRETTLVWNRTTGRPLHNAIVWQDRRTAPICARLKHLGHEPLAAERTGLLIDPYFSATKIAWILDNVPGARGAAERGELAFGTVDSFLIWRLTNRKEPRDRCDQRLAYAASEHPYRRLGRRTAGAVPTFPVRCCPMCVIVRPISASRRRSTSAFRRRYSASRATSRPR